MPLIPSRGKFAVRFARDTGTRGNTETRGFSAGQLNIKERQI